MTATEAEEGLQYSTSARVLVPEVNPSNIAPTISLIAPADGSVINRRIPITAVAVAEDPDDEVFVVEFRENGVLKGVCFEPPYACKMDEAPITITATVYDLYGASASAEASVTKIADGTGIVPPNVLLTSPERDGVYEESEDLVAVAQPVDMDGTIAEVEFYVDGVLEAEMTAPPYELDLNGLATGRHRCAGVAFDDEGAAAYRSVEFTVRSDADSDGDGLGDDFEQLIIDFDPFDAFDSLDDVNPQDDFDGDGVTNIREFQFGTDPTDGTTKLPFRGTVTSLLLMLVFGVAALQGRRGPRPRWRRG